MALPPVMAGAVHLTVADALPATAVPIPSVPGTVSTGAAAVGVPEFDSAENNPVPTALIAATWNRTAVPLTKPVTSKLVAPAPAGRRAPTWALAALTTLTE